MDPRLVPPHPAGSPYLGWALPDIRHCEAVLPGWIATPADTWSNLAYIAAAALIWRRARPGGLLSARGLAPVSVAIGVTSFLFHASYSYAGQVLDYAGMFLLTGWAFARGLWRWGSLEERGALRLWGALFVASMAALFLFRRLGWGVQHIMLAQALAAAGMEILLMTKRRDAPEYGSFWLMQLLLAVGYACWHADHTDALCRPDDHLFQLHAAWHALTAGAFVAAWRFHEGVDGLRSKR